MEPNFWSLAAYNELKLGWHYYGSKATYQPSAYTSTFNDLN